MLHDSVKARKQRIQAGAGNSQAGRADALRLLKFHERKTRVFLETVDQITPLHAGPSSKF